MLEKDMRERWRPHIRQVSRKSCAAFMSASLILMAEQPAPQEHTNELRQASDISHAEKNHNFSTVDRLAKIDANTSTIAVLSGGTDTYTVVRDEMPSRYSDVFEKSLQLPLARLAAEKGITPAVAMRHTDPQAKIASDRENGMQFSGTNMIVLDINSKRNSRGGLYEDPNYMLDIMNHEFLHALNDQWNTDISNRGNFEDEIYSAKATRLVDACYALNKDILEQYMESNRVDVAETFEDISEEAIEDINEELHINPALARDFVKKPFELGAAALRNNDPRIYTTEQMSKPTCSLPDLRYIFANVADVDINLLLKAYDNLSDISVAQYVLYETAAWTYKCVTEGYSQRDLMGDESVHLSGHPQDNLTEMSSSLITVLLSNPLYIPRCLETLDDKKSALLSTYISASLDMMFYKTPEIEEIVRQNPESSEVLDQIMPSAA